MIVDDARKLGHKTLKNIRILAVQRVQKGEAPELVYHSGKTWGKKGETPVVSATGARHGMSLISAVSARGSLRFMVHETGGVIKPIRWDARELKTRLISAKKW